MNNFPKIIKKVINAVILSFALFSIFWSAVPVSNAALAGTWQYPLKGPWEVSFGFGATYNGRYHLADDKLDPAGTPVFAPANGKIVRIENWPSCGNYGGLVLMEITNYDGSRVVALMGHLIGFTIAVSEDQQVSRGQLLGYLGDYDQNGCWEEHIHFGVNKGAYQESPWKYWGYGDQNMLKDWENPSLYVPARQKFVEVNRVPANSPDRYQTAVGVSRREYPQPKSLDNVLLASGTIHVDGLAAAPLTQALNAPLLLTKKTKLPIATQDEIKRVLKPKGTLYLLGGSATIDPTIENKIKSWGYATKRIAGANREDTALAAAKYLTGADTVFITNRSTFPDAISAGGPATQFEDPILLTKVDTLSNATKDYLVKTKDLTRAVIVGGPASIGNDVITEIKNARKDMTVWRVGGADRYATNIALNQQFTKNPTKVILATGQDYPDALSGGSLAAKEQAALIITKKDQLPAKLDSYLSPHKSNFTDSLVLGGQTALPEQVRVQLVNLLNDQITTAAYSTSAKNGLADNRQSTSSSTIKADTWLKAASQKTDTLSLPVPANYHAQNINYRGARVTLMQNNDKRQDFVPLIINRLPQEPSKSITQTIATWYGVDDSQIKVISTDKNLHFLSPLPGLVPTKAAFLVKAGKLYLIESRLQNKKIDHDLILTIRDLN